MRKSIVLFLGASLIILLGGGSLFYFKTGDLPGVDWWQFRGKYLVNSPSSYAECIDAVLAGKVVEWEWKPPVPCEFGGKLFYPERNAGIGAMSSSVPSTEIDIAGWKTYRNEKYGFEVKYPEDWYYGGGERGNSQYVLCFNPKGLSGDCSVLLTVNWNTTLEAWMKNFIKKSGDIVEERAIEVNGVVEKKLIIGEIENLFVEKNGRVYHFTNTLPSRMFDGFLSSFVVIAPTPIQPVIKVDIRGPVILATGQTGTWEVIEPGATRFAVIWADGSPVSIGEYSGIPYDNEFTVNPRFTHAFSKPGTYFVQFFAKSSDGKVNMHGLDITVR